MASQNTIILEKLFFSILAVSQNYKHDQNTCLKPIYLFLTQNIRF